MDGALPSRIGRREAASAVQVLLACELPAFVGPPLCDAPRRSNRPTVVQIVCTPALMVPEAIHCGPIISSREFPRGELIHGSALAFSIPWPGRRAARLGPPSFRATTVADGYRGHIPGEAELLPRGAAGAPIIHHRPGLRLPTPPLSVFWDCLRCARVRAAHGVPNPEFGPVPANRATFTR